MWSSWWSHVLMLAEYTALSANSSDSLAISIMLYSHSLSALNSDARTLRRGHCKISTVEILQCPRRRVLALSVLELVPFRPRLPETIENLNFKQNQQQHGRRRRTICFGRIIKRHPLLSVRSKLLAALLVFSFFASFVDRRDHVHSSTRRTCSS